MVSQYELNVYNIYGNEENTFIGRQHFGYGVGRTEREAIKNYADLNPHLRDTLDFKRELSAVKVEVEGHRIIALPLEEKVKIRAK